MGEFTLYFAFWLLPECSSESLNGFPEVLENQAFPGLFMSISQKMGHKRGKL